MKANLDRSPSVIAIIPARGGSKGLPGKNKMDLCGSPLVVWTIKAALESLGISKVHVSTDDPEIARIAEEAGAHVPYMRPDALATDQALTIDVVEYALDFYKSAYGQQFDYVLLLEPTSPIRSPGQLDLILKTQFDREVQQDALVTVGAVREHPSIVKKIDNGLIRPFTGQEIAATRRQEYEPAYFPFGVAYLVKVHVLLQHKTFYPNRTGHYLVGREQCQEVDDFYDFLAVESSMKHILGLS